MSQFNFNDYQKVVAAASSASNSGFAKVGFFKLANDGDVAFARLNVGSTDDLEFASVHTINMGGNKFMKVSCLNPLGSYNGSCPLCAAVAAGNKAVSKAGKKVYLQMMVSYKDPVTGAPTVAEPVIWERPAGFSKEVANKLSLYGDLREVLIMITRNGVKGDMKTTYSMEVVPAQHPFYASNVIPNDFSAFKNFNIAKHSYWEKTTEEINTYLTTGAFPEVIKTDAAATTAAPAATATPAYTGATPSFLNNAAAATPAATGGIAPTANTGIAPTANTPTVALPKTEAKAEKPAEKKDTFGDFSGFSW